MRQDLENFLQIILNLFKFSLSSLLLFSFFSFFSFLSSSFLSFLFSFFLLFCSSPCSLLFSDPILFQLLSSLSLLSLSLSLPQAKVLYNFPGTFRGDLPLTKNGFVTNISFNCISFSIFFFLLPVILLFCSLLSPSFSFSLLFFCSLLFLKKKIVSLNWWEGEHLGRKGKFPCNYIELGRVAGLSFSFLSFLVLFFKLK